MNKSSGKSRHALKYLLSGLLSGYHDVNTRVIYHSTFRKIMKWAFRKTVSQSLRWKKKIQIGETDGNNVHGKKEKTLK